MDIIAIRIPNIINVCVNGYPGILESESSDPGEISTTTDSQFDIGEYKLSRTETTT